MKTIAFAGFALATLMSGVLPAVAADLSTRPVYKAPPITPSYYNWSGFYVGGHVGGAWADKDWTQTFPAAFGGNAASFDANGFIGGGQIGYNWQTGSWVFGIEADASWSGQSGSAVQTNTPAWTSSTDINRFGTVTGRLGFAWDRVLVYGKGGFAWANEDHAQTFTPVGGPTALVSSTSATHTGWTVGAGLEYALSDNWSAKVEYNYIDLGTRSVGFANGAPAPAARAVDSFDVDQTMHVVKFGVNYRFNWGAPIVSRY
jgi:outer membrane immunogenic protein